MSGFFHDRQLVQWFAPSEMAARMASAMQGDWPGGCKRARV
jgi:hypothetical protein